MRHYVTIVSGLPRSGTSMMMGALIAGGMEALIDGVREADDDNPRGYYEFEPVKRSKDDASWLQSATGKVVKVVYRLLFHLPDEYDYRVVFMQRDLKEVMASQRRMLERSGQPVDSISDKKLEALFANDLVKCEKHLAERANFKVLYVNHRDMINESLAEAARIHSFLDGGLDLEAMAAAVDPSLYRNRG
jgi:hypothetical protein